MPVSRDAIWDIARGLGFASMGVTLPSRALPLPGREPKPLGFEPRSIIVMIYPTFRWEPAPPDQVDIVGAYIGMNQAHLRGGRWVEALRALGVQAERLTAVRAKTAALNAGLGVYRANTLLYTERQGSYHSIQVFAVSEEYEPDEPSRCGNPERASLAPGCKECGRCASICPTGALDGKGGIVIERCIRFHMFSGRVVPIEYRRLMGRRLIGCEVCQMVCPAQPQSIEIRRREDWDWPRLENLLEPSRQTLDSFGDAIGYNYARAHRIQAQAAIIAGNLCGKRYLPAIERLAVSSDGVVSEHAQWAAERIRYG
ncbi:MAG: hypothetical protein LBH66_00550 [Oscillospiraceae bacterium]|jgi:epoxyqueuosine reductase|nr:hypothetical protein [Oscillospiraceae bacterium]